MELKHLLLIPTACNTLCTKVMLIVVGRYTYNESDAMMPIYRGVEMVAVSRKSLL
jgi:hypothetical protein